MFRKAWFATAAVVGAVLALGAAAATAWADEKPLGTMDKMFVRKVAQGNIAEVMAGKLALQKSKNEKVRSIATMLVAGHSKAQEDLKPVAATHKITLPRDTDARHKAMYRRLTRLSGTAFDKAFLKGMVKGHNATVALFRKQMDKGQDSHVREYAAEHLPDIQTHTRMIHDVAGNMGITVAAKQSAKAAGAKKAMPH